MDGFARDHSSSRHRSFSTAECSYKMIGRAVGSFGATFCTVDGELVGRWEMLASRLSTKQFACYEEISAAGPNVAMNLHGPLAAWRRE